jgi:hypothetical protein
MRHEQQGECQVRCLLQSGWIDAQVVWCHETLDLALLKLNQARLSLSAPPIRLGRISKIQPVPCTAIGFPDAQVRSDRSRDTEQIDGRILPLTTLKAGRLTVQVRGGSPTGSQTPGHSVWGGMSGAAVFVGDVLVGVIEYDPAHFGSDRLVASPISSLVDDAETRNAFNTAGVSLDLEPVPTVGGVDTWRTSRLHGQLGTPSLLLRPERGVVPFRGRHREIQSITEWCTSRRVRPSVCW